MTPSLPRKRLAIATIFALSCACSRKPAAAPAAAPAGAAHQEVVQYCAGRDLAPALGSLGSEVGSTCDPRDPSAQALAKELFEAGVRIGAERGNVRVRGAGIRAGSEQVSIAADIAAKIADRAREADEKAAKTADEELTKTVERAAAGSACLPPPAARAVAEKGVRCGSAAYDTDEFQAEFAHAFGGICEHQHSQEDCLQRADTEYKRMPRGEGAESAPSPAGVSR